MKRASNTGADIAKGRSALRRRRSSTRNAPGALVRGCFGGLSCLVFLRKNLKINFLKAVFSHFKQT